MGRQENVEIFEDTFALCEQNSTLRNAIEQSTKKQKLYASTACFGLHSRKNVIAIQIGIRLFLLHKAIDGDESELLNGQFLDVRHLLSLTVNFIEGHRLGIILCLINCIAVCQLQSDIELTVLAVDGVVIVIAADVADTFQFPRTNL